MGFNLEELAADEFLEALARFVDLHVASQTDRDGRLEGPRERAKDECRRMLLARKWERC